MGAYLSEPITKKYSSDESSDYIDVGASSMQGWRIRQEDAHNCILNFDENTSFFAVYDGHGGSEVAMYCAEKLPEFMKGLKSYKEKDFEQTLKDTFLGFDATLLEDDVIEELKRLAGEKYCSKDNEFGEEEEEEEEDLVELRQEGVLPLDQVLEKYKGFAAEFPFINKLKEDEPGPSSSGISKPHSPFLRGRRNPIRGCSHEKNLKSEDSASASLSSTPCTTETIEESTCAVSSSVVNVNESSTQKDEVSSGSVDKTCDEKITKCSSPDSSVTQIIANAPEWKLQNGDISSHQEETNEEDGDEKASSTVTNSEVHRNQANGEMSSSASASASPLKFPEGTQCVSGTAISSSTIGVMPPKSIEGVISEDGSSSSEDDIDFQAEENSSTEDGDEEPCNHEGDSDEYLDEEEADDDLYAFRTNMIEEPGKDSGCTAVVAVLHGRDLYVANAGDSRCVVCRKGEAVEMSLDHKPEDFEENARILQAGGKVTFDGRVNGGLNLSRAIGDHGYKMNKDLPPEKQMISALPDVRKLIISPDDEFMVLACDGIWNHMSSYEVVKYVKKKINDGQEKMSQICEELFDICLAPNTIGDGTGCDNMTAIIVRFKPNILELPTRISAESEAIAVGISKRRCMSPTQHDCEGSNENSSKRFKTDDNCLAECDSGSNVIEEPTDQTGVENSS